MRALVGILVAVSVIGCAAQIEHDLKRASARAVIPTPYPDSVQISEIRRDKLGNPTRWVATTHSGVYDCSREAGEHEAICAKREPAR